MIDEYAGSIVVVNTRPDIIYEYEVRTSTGTSIVFQSRLGDRPPAATPLTYDELFHGIQSVLDVVVFTEEYHLLDAGIYKDGWIAATFGVFFEEGAMTSF